MANTGKKLKSALKKGSASIVPPPSISSSVAVWLDAEAARADACREGLRLCIDEAKHLPPSLRKRVGSWKRHVGIIDGVRSAVVALKLVRNSDLTNVDLAEWPARCQYLLECEWGELQKHERSAAALLAFRLLVEGCLIAERIDDEVLIPLRKRNIEGAFASARACDPRTWSQQGHAWRSRFRQQLLAVWQECAVTAWRLVTAAGGNWDVASDLEELSDVLAPMLQLLADVNNHWDRLKIQLAELQTSASPGAEVALSIYALHGVGRLSAVAELAGLGGAYHVGVEVYWLEWSFGYCENGSGVSAVQIGESTLGALQERVKLGETPCSPNEVLGILLELHEKWHGNSYDLLRRNCGHFCAEFVQLLKVGSIPPWVNALAEMGEHLTQWLRTSVVGESQDCASDPEPEMEELVDSTVEDDVSSRGESESNFSSKAFTWETKYISHCLAQAQIAKRKLAGAFDLDVTARGKDPKGDTASDTGVTVNTREASSRSSFGDLNDDVW
jgi:hypothetical protein